MTGSPPPQGRVVTGGARGPAMTTSLSTTDRVLLTDLVHRYALLVDEDEPAAVASLFAADGVLATATPPHAMDPDTEHVGRDAISRTMSALQGFDATFHAVTGAVLDLGEEPDTATGRVACVAHHLSRRDDRPVDLVWTVRYRDRYVREEDGWRFARRAVHVMSVESRTLKAARR